MLIYYPPQIIANAETGMPLTGLKGIAGTVIARGNASSSPVIFEDQAGTAIIAAAGLTVTENVFVRGFYVDDTFGRVSFYGDGIEVPLVSEEGNAARQEEIYEEFTEALEDQTAIATTAATSAAEARTEAEASRVAAEAAQVAAEAVEAGAVSWGSVSGKPTEFPPSSHTHGAADITSGTIPSARLGSGAASGSTFLRGDGTWAVPAGTGGGGGAVTSVAGKNGDVSLVKSDVGLGNVDNTSDTNKPISAATQTALNGKAATSHTHTVANVTGLQAALDSKRGTNDAIAAGLITSGTVAPARLGSGTPSENVFLRGDGAWASPAASGVIVLGTSDPIPDPPIDGVLYIRLAETSGGGGDTSAPTVPAGLVQTAVSPSSAAFSWTAATDNTGVTGYQVYRDGVSQGTLVLTSFSQSGLTAETAYSYTVRARDAAGNWSAQSAPLVIETLAASGSGAVTFDAVGPGGTPQRTSGTTRPMNITWSHTCTGSNVALLVQVNYGPESSFDVTSAEIAVTYGGTPMTLLGRVYPNNQPTGGLTELYVLLNAPAGSATVSVTATKDGTHGQELVGGSVSFAGVASVGTPITAVSGTSAGVATTVPSSSSGVVVAAHASGAAMASPTGTACVVGVGTGANAITDLSLRRLSGSASVAVSTAANADWQSVIAVNLVAA